MARCPLVVLFALSLIACGCGSSGGKPLPATSTTLYLATSTVLQQGTVAVSAQVTGIVPAQSPGTVTFATGSTVLATVSIAQSGTVNAVLTFGNTVGTFPITAAYSGNAASAPSTSAPLSVNVQAATTTALSDSPTSIQQGQAFVLTATVTRAANASGYATGSVTFANQGQTLGSASLTDGVARLTVPSTGLSVGTYAMTAMYAGDQLDAPSASNTLTAYVTPAVDVLTQRYNVARTGVQPAETTLTPANVSAATFGKLYTFPTDGYAYPQPLYVSNYTMADGNQHNVLFVETSSGSVYAFDADNNNPSSGFLWHTSVNPGSEQVVTTTDLSCTDTVPSTSVVGTPVIDRTLGVMYLVAKSKLVSGNTTTYYQRIHALDLATGSERLGGPTLIQAQVNGTAPDAVNGVVSFQAFNQNQRAALAEANGSVWIAWASHCDQTAYHGWVIGYDATNLANQTAVFNDTPNGTAGGIWMSAGGISADNAGNLYVVAGNGTFDANDGGQDFGDTALRLAIGNHSLTVADWFTPTNEQYLSNNDMDFGTADALLFDDPSSGLAPHLLMTGDKTGKVYLMNRDDLGKFSSGAANTDGDLEEGPVSSQLFSSFAYFNGQVYMGPGGEPLGALPYTPGTESTAGYLSFTPSSESTATFSASYPFGGLPPVISANGTANAIAWGLDVNGSALNAFDAGNLANQLYSSNTNAGDQAPAGVKFTVPTVANGKVYVAGQGQVAVYGLLSPAQQAGRRR